MTRLFLSASRVAFVAAGVFVLLAMSGCNSSTSGDDSAPASPQEQEAAIQKIQNNPNMPAAAKAAAIASFRKPTGAAQQEQAAKARQAAPQSAGK